MNRVLKGTLLILLSIAMLAWFIYSIMNPPTRPSETYAMDWILIFVRLIGAFAGLAGGVFELVRK